ncbi:HupE/UreJ family protein [Candidatus Nitrosacidococcus tergens]|uniref:HupE/UreJ protein n=1 Tax=Candidatus Nitrosacidococcus tergens TaxID=553981 RepID=A0A7G1Q8K7_9GAMM|nr:HupE/UreJ family protein [Candidatus Nitrosacidococcus tergens]CAB1275071.1 HupE/UreJ protein [Candidatus Nitrosacidococcus tergens]
MNIKHLFSFLGLLLFSGTIWPHPGHVDHESIGFFHGLLHPFTGFDHLMAMFAVGLWAAQQQGKTRLAIPVTFISVMLLGGLLGIYFNITLPFVENAIAVSVLALGLFVALTIQLPLFLSIGITALFAINHGYAHGIEIPTLDNPTGFAFGFVLATALLHSLGYGLAYFMPTRFAALTRILGVFSVGAGLWLLTT